MNMLDMQLSPITPRKSNLHFKLNIGKQNKMIDEFSFSLDDEIHKSRNDLPHTPKSGRISTLSTSTLSQYLHPGLLFF